MAYAHLSVQAARIKSSFIQNKHIKPCVSGVFKSSCAVFAIFQTQTAPWRLVLLTAVQLCVRAYVRVRAAAAAHMACRSLFIVCRALPARSPRRSDGANEPPTLSAAEM